MRRGADVLDGNFAMKNTVKLLGAVALACALSPAGAQATTLSFTAKLTSSIAVGSHLSDLFDYAAGLGIGDTITGNVTYDPSVPRTGGNATSIGVYNPSGATMHIFLPSGAISLSNIGMLVFNGVGLGSSDSVYFSEQQSTPLGGNVAIQSNFNLDFNGSDTVFGNTSIPNTLSLANFPNSTLEVETEYDITNFVGKRDMFFQLTSVTPAATPLPASLPLFASGLGALGLAGWRKRRKRTAV